MYEHSAFYMTDYNMLMLYLYKCNTIRDNAIKNVSCTEPKKKTTKKHKNLNPFFLNFTVFYNQVRVGDALPL